MTEQIRFKKCPECGYEVMVFEVINGTSHTIAQTIICAECVDIEKLKVAATQDNVYLDEQSRDLIQ